MIIFSLFIPDTRLSSSLILFVPLFIYFIFLVTCLIHPLHSLLSSLSIPFWFIMRRCCSRGLQIHIILIFLLFFFSFTDFWMRLQIPVSDIATNLHPSSPKRLMLFLLDIRQTSHMAPQSLFISSPIFVSFLLKPSTYSTSTSTSPLPSPPIFTPTYPLYV